MHIIHAQHGAAIERQVFDKIHKRLLQPRKVMTVGFHVIGINIGDDGENGVQVQKRGVRLVCFDHNKFAAAQLGVGAAAVELAAYHKGRIQPAPCQHTGGQAGGSRFAVRPRNSDALFQPHQFRQHDGARHNRNIACTCRQHFRIVAADCCRYHHGIGVYQIAFRMPHIDCCTQFL